MDDWVLPFWTLALGDQAITCVIARQLEGGAEDLFLFIQGLPIPVEAGVQVDSLLNELVFDVSSFVFPSISLDFHYITDVLLLVHHGGIVLVLDLVQDADTEE